MDFRITEYDLLSEQSGWDIQCFLVADLAHFKLERCFFLTPMWAKKHWEDQSFFHRAS